MASSENIASFEPFLFRHAIFPDSWISEAYARDAETLTKALQTTFSNNISNHHNSAADSLNINPLLNLVNSDSTTTAPPTPTASNLSASDPETSLPSNKRHAIAATGKVSKRKSRASKRSQTTFITADPANFRQMVQQVTGVRFSNSQLPLVPVLKPEPQRPVNRLHGAGGCLPTLDTSAFLLDHHQQQQVVLGTSMAGPTVGSGSSSFIQPVLTGGGAGLDLDCVSSFPTLESWKVM